MGIIEDFHLHRNKLIKTIILCFAYVTLGFGIAIIGPTLLDLSLLIDSTVSTLTYLLVTRAIGTLISCFLTDFYKKYLSFEKLLAISQFIMGITLFSLPFFNLIGMNVAIFMYGFGSGCFQVFGDLWTIRIWNKQRAAIYIQYIYFFFSLGAFIAPLLASPFLLPDNTMNDNLNTMIEQPTNQTNTTDIINSDLPIKHSIKDLKVMYPYIIAGSYAIAYSVILYAFDLYSNGQMNRKNGYKAIDNQDQNDKKPNDSKDKKVTYDERSSLLDNDKSTSQIMNSSEFQANSEPRPNLLLIKILSILFINLFIGFDVTFGTYLSVFVFVEESFQLSTQQGAYLTAAFWAAYTFAFRIPGYFIIQTRGPSLLMNIEMIITFFSTVILSFLLISNSIPLLWISAILEGIGMSIVYSTYLALIKTYFEPSARLAAAFVCSFNLGSFLYPLIVGLYIEKYPMIFIYLSVSCCFATTFIYACVRFLFRKW